MIPAFLGVLGGLTIPIIDLPSPVRSPQPFDSCRVVGDLDDRSGIVAYFVLRSRSLGSHRSAIGDDTVVARATSMTSSQRRRRLGGRRHAQSKIDSGQCAVTTTFGMSTISLIRRSIATLVSR